MAALTGAEAEAIEEPVPGPPGQYPMDIDTGNDNPAAAATGAAACLCKRKRGEAMSASSSSSSSSAGESKKETFDDNKSYKVYIVLHGQGIRASPESSDVGYIHTGSGASDTATNFYTVPEKTRVFRMVPPGHVFMSHIDINVKLRNFFGHNISKWIQPFKLSAANHVTAKQAAALGNWDSVDPEKLDFNRSRAIFNAMLQLFVTGDEITNERLETDYGSPEALSEFGIWIGRPTDNIGFPRNPEYVSNDTLFLDGEGNAKEITLGSVIYQIREKIKRESKSKEEPFFEFYVANCSPVSQHMLAKKRLVRKDDGTWQRQGEYSITDINASKFWYNTLIMYNKRISLYHNGISRLEQLKENTRRPVKDAERKLLTFPANDTIWGMMDDEERQDNYKLMNGFLHFYPRWIEAAEEEQKIQIKNEMKFYIQCISTPFVNKIRDGLEHQRGISQTTIHIPEAPGAAASGAAARKKSYYTLSEQLARKLQQKINVSQRAEDGYNNSYISEYCNLLQYIFGQRSSEADTAYIEGKPKRISQCKVPSPQGGGATRKKKRRRKRKKKTKKKKKKKRKKKKKKKKRRRKKRTKRKK